MDLEIADFERTVSQLQSEVREKVDVISNLMQELDHQKQKCASLDAEIGKYCVLCAGSTRLKHLENTF